jgi:hypothetical protein
VDAFIVDVIKELPARVEKTTPFANRLEPFNDDTTIVLPCSMEKLNAPPLILEP